MADHRPQHESPPATGTPGTTREPLLWFGLAAATIAAWRIAVIFLNGYDLSFEEAQYWAWSRALDLGYLSKPPGIAWIIAGETRLCGDGEGCLRLGAVISHLIAALFVYATGAFLFGRRAGGWAGLLYLVAPAVAFSSMIVSTDAPLLMLWSAALYGFAKAVVSGRRRWWLMTGAALGLGLLTKYAMGYFIVCAALFLLVSKEHRRWLRRPEPYLALLLGLAISAPNIYWNLENDLMTVRNLGRTAAWGDGNYNILKALERTGAFLGIQFAVSGTIVFGAYVLLLLGFPGFLRDWRARLLIAMSLPVFVAMIGQAFVSKAYGNWAAVGHAAVLILVVGFWVEKRVRWPLVASLALGLAASAALHHFDWLMRLPGGSALARIDPFSRFRGRAELGRQLGRIAAGYPDAPVLTLDREPTAEFKYHTKPRRMIIKWNPTGQINDYFDLSSDLRPYADRRFLVLLPLGGNEVTMDFFCRSRQLGTLRARPSREREIRYDVYLVGDWRGFDWDNRAPCLNGKRIGPPKPGYLKVPPRG